MVDVMLMQALMRAVPDKAALLIVGDIDQLPRSVPAKCWPMSSHPAPCRWCASPKYSGRRPKVTSSSMPTSTKVSCPIFANPKPRAISISRLTIRRPRVHIIKLVETRIPRRFGLDAIRDVQVLCPMNRGGVGARSINIELQAALNPAGERKVERFGWTFAPGDKVMQIENDYDKEVYNGDIGFVAEVEPEEGNLTASFDGRSVAYGFGELDVLVPAYAASIHSTLSPRGPFALPLSRNHKVTGSLRQYRLQMQGSDGS